jgi:hypothetical protein
MVTEALKRAEGMEVRPELPPGAMAQGCKAWENFEAPLNSIDATPRCLRSLLFCSQKATKIKAEEKN